MNDWLSSLQYLFYKLLRENMFTQDSSAHIPLQEFTPFFFSEIPITLSSAILFQDIMHMEGHR